MTVLSLPRIYDIQALLFDEKAAEAFFIENVFYKTMDCSSCGGSMARRPARSVFECRKCNVSVSIRAGSFFSNVKVKCCKVLFAGYLWLSRASVQAIIAQTGMSSKTVCTLLGFFRQLVSDSLDSEDMKIGGQDVVVEIDESKFGKRKYQRGHRVEGVWIVGGIERTAEKKVFLAKVESRDAETLQSVIARHVLPGSIIYTDLWRGYAGIEAAFGFRHQTVNHSASFVDPVSGTHTNTVEGLWNGIKINLKPRNRVKNGMDEHLFEFIWRKRHRARLWEAFIEAMREVHYE